MSSSKELTDFEPVSPRELPRYEIEEQLRFYRNELDKKDELIRDLTKLNSVNFVQPSPKYIEAGGRSAEKLEQIRSQVEKLHQVVDENRGIIHEKNTIICDLRAENEKFRVDNLRSTQRTDELEQQVEKQVEIINSYKAAEEQHDKIIHMIQQDMKAKNNKLLILMSQLRSSEARFAERLASEEFRIKSLEGALADLSHVLECEPTAEQCILKVIYQVKAP